MKLGNKMKVIPLGVSTTDKLKEHFVPQVKARCEGVDGLHFLDLVYGLRLMAHESSGDMIMYHLTITPVSISQDPTLTEIVALCQALDYFTRNEEAPLVWEGREWRLGDGDDTLATFMSEGRFCIWLRGWPVGSQ